MTFAGSGGIVVTSKRCCPCILVDEDLLMDCGSGSLANLRKLKLDLLKIRKIIISHHHADHMSDLIPLLWAMEFEERKETLEIISYGDIEDFTKNLLTLMNTPSEFTIFNLKFTSFMGNEEINGAKAFLTVHKPSNLAFRIQRNGKSVCYTGDTSFYEPLANFASNCDLLIHEATFLKEQEQIAALTNHSTACDAARIAERAKAKALALFHICPYNQKFETKYLKQAAEEFSGEIFIAKDLMKIEL